MSEEGVEGGIYVPFLGRRVPRSVLEMARDPVTGLVDPEVLMEYSRCETRLEGHDPSTSGDKPRRPVEERAFRNLCK